MTTTTPNLGLIKPERSDNYSVDVMSENMDIIDGKIAKLEAGEFETVNCAGTITADVGNFEKLTNLTLDYTVSTTDIGGSISTTANGFSYVHPDYLPVSITKLPYTITYSKNVGLITLGECKNTVNLNYTVSMSYSSSSTSYGSSLHIYLDGVLANTITIAEGGRSGSTTITIPYGHTPEISIQYGNSGERWWKPTISVSNVTYYLNP